MYTDPIADYLTRIRNAVAANHKVVEIPASNLKKEITKIKNCTKKYRSAVRKYYKTSSKLRKYRGTDNTRRTALYKLSEKANDKANQIKVECNKSLFNLFSIIVN